MQADIKKIELKWKKKWRETGTYKVDMGKKPKKKWYNLMMFPYPSAEGLHVGNMYAFTGADVFGRFKAMQGYEVFEPIGLDGFGIHSENYAIKVGKHPAEQAKISEKRFYEQLDGIGNRFSREQHLETYDPEYYKWTQWLFVKMFEKGLAYRKKSLVNWCPSCKTVLSDEQVEAGKCERCKSETEKKETDQWFFKISEYSQRLLSNIEKIDWPEKIKIAQRNWIGRKEGINITYKIKGLDKKIEVFTTRPDTNFGATFVVLAPEHELAQEMGKKDKKIREYIDKSLKKSSIDRIAEGRKKTGVFTGLYAINDLTGKEMPIYVTDFVLMDVGTGAVVGVPGHDKRDLEFAQEFGLEVIRVVVGSDGVKGKITKLEQVQEEEGKMINSGFLDGMEIHQATEEIMDYLEKKGMGKRVVSFRLRDWCISRQRYWGPPIPMMECSKCGLVAEKEENLPVLLPEMNHKDVMPTGDGKSPLEKASKDWQETKCSKCGGKARRETDVSDTFLDSAWYFLRYLSTEDKKNLVNKEIASNWLPVDAYIGGAEHAVLHLLYSRFMWMVLQDWGVLDKSLGDEPFPYLFGHGLIIKDGAKMSKSRGNVVNPDEYIDKFGVDALRMYLMFIGPYEQGGDFKDAGMGGMRRFLDRVNRLVGDKSKINGQVKVELQHRTVKRVSEAMVGFKFNVAIAALMEWVNSLEKDGADKESLKILVLMLAPMAPYLTEEWWEKLGEKFSVHEQDWPEFKAKLAQGETVTLVVQVNSKLRARLELDLDKAEDKEEVLKLARENERVKEFLTGKKIVREIFIPSKLVNLVVG